MEYIPRYSQPFTLEEARQLAVPIITEEIARLQNSIAHLRRTQDELKDALATSPDDPDLTQAFEENDVVIGSQNERISMLQMVLAEKGNANTGTTASGGLNPIPQPSAPPDSVHSLRRDEIDVEGNSGIYL
ncbi:hypothetical protein C8Q80DRAFT_1153627 [Daedaleopsis nitida]|nr:hypothetical protein C8Q80DRAFT_1153627 [Daedaleopsis nitida]